VQEFLNTENRNILWEDILKLISEFQQKIWLINHTYTQIVSDTQIVIIRDKFSLLVKTISHIKLVYHTHFLRDDTAKKGQDMVQKISLHFTLFFGSMQKGPILSWIQKKRLYG